MLALLDRSELVLLIVSALIIGAALAGAFRSGQARKKGAHRRIENDKSKTEFI